MRTGPVSPWPPAASAPPSRRSSRRGWAPTVALVLLVLAVVPAAVANVTVDGLSMAPTLRHGQYLLVNKLVYASVDGGLVEWLRPAEAARTGWPHYLFRAPQRGDIVVFWLPSSSARPSIKRVIALPGEVVEVRAGRVLVDGAGLDEPYIRARPAYTVAATRVPAGHYFVLGDNRNNSSDSHLFGVLPADHIVGQAWLSYWPTEVWGVLATPAYPDRAGHWCPAAGTGSGRAGSSVQ